MSAVVRRIPRAQRLQVVAEFRHERIVYSGDIFDFIRRIMDEGWTGKGEFTVSQGQNFMGLTFDMREKIGIDRKSA